MRRRAFVSALVFLLGTLGLTAHAASNATLPDWVTQAAATPGQWGNARAVFLLEDTLLTVRPDGRAVERYRGVVKILRPRGRDYAQPSVWFSNDEKLENFHVWGIGPDGHRYAMKDAEYVETGDPGFGLLYVDVRRKLAAPPGADPGGVVAWEYTKELPPYFSEDTWGLQNPVPTERSVYEIDLPPGWHQYAVWSRHAAIEAATSAPDHYRWELNHIPGVDLSEVPLAPAWAAVAGRMTVHFAADPLPQGDALWAKIGNWYSGLVAPRSEGKADIAAAARSMAGDGDFFAKLTRVADFMQRQIRYVGIEVGIGGWQPHAAEDVFHSRYGDCKDKATLMIAMLDAVGIRAAWVSLDDRRGVIDPKAPTLFGNHMIAAIEIPKGYDDPRLQARVTAQSGRKYLIFDPTNEYVPVGQLPEYEQGSWALLSDGPESQLIQLPVLNPDTDTTVRRGNLELTADGTLKGEVTLLRSGPSAWAMRNRLAMDSDKEQRQMVERMLERDLSSFTLGDEKAAHVRELEKPLELDYSFTAPLYAKAAGNLLLVRPRVLGTVVEGLNEKPRTVPISFDGVRTWRDEFDVKIPPGYAVDDIPAAVDVDAGFATYHSEVKADGGVLHYRREYVLKQLELPPDQYSALRRLEAQITSDENSNAVLKKQ